MSDIVVIFEPIPTIEVVIEKAPDVVVEFPSSQGASWPPWGPGADGDGVWVPGEVPIGVINGVNIYFSIAFTPSNGVRIYQNGLRLKENIDYTRSSNILTFASPPVAWDLLLADYNY